MERLSSVVRTCDGRVAACACDFAPPSSPASVCVSGEVPASPVPSCHSLAHEGFANPVCCNQYSDCVAGHLYCMCEFERWQVRWAAFVHLPPWNLLTEVAC
jgi:hypothetical protein